MLRPGHAIAVCVLALLTVGVVMVNSAGMTIHAKVPLTIESILLSRTTVYAGIAMLALIACALLPIRRLLYLTAAQPLDASTPALEEPILSPTWFRALIREYVNLWPLWIGVFGLLALLASVYAPGISSPKNGSHRWVNMHLPGLESIQPSELAKWGMVLLVAWYASRSASRMKSFWLGLVPGLAAIGLVAGFVVIEDLGTGALMVAASTIILLAAGARLWQMLILLPVPVAGTVLAIVTNPYRMHRIESFTNPYLDPQGKGFHMIQSMVAVTNGQIFGRGLGGGLQKFGYLPEATTDFIFAIICEELGLAGVAIVLCLLGALIWSVWTVVRNERIAMLKLLGLGVMATVGVQAIINLAVVTGLGPTKGIALPLISSGGTGWILTAAALGLVIAIDRAQALEARVKARADGEFEDEPESYAVPAFGAVAVSAAAASMSIAEIKPAPQPEALVATAEEPAEEEVVAAAVEEDVAADDDVADEEEFAVSEEPAAVEQVVEAPVQSQVDDSAAEMFEGLVVADPVSYIAEAAPQIDVIPGEPGKTGLLFDTNPSAQPPAAPAPTTSPTIIITDHAKNYLTRSGEESAT